MATSKDGFIVTSVTRRQTLGSIEILGRKLEAAKVEEDDHLTVIKTFVEQTVSDEMMSMCMDECRAILIQAGIVDASVPPMMLGEAVISYVHKQKVSYEEALALAVKYQAAPT